ncbi:DNA topoisomerase [Staphylococcus warneri]
MLQTMVEGSNIFYSILNEAGITDKPILRYANGSLVHEDIRQSFKQLENNDKDILMFHEAKTRQISDWLVGMNLTSLYTNIFRKKGINEVFPVGRVQTPTLFFNLSETKGN